MAIKRLMSLILPGLALICLGGAGPTAKGAGVPARMMIDSGWMLKSTREFTDAGEQVSQATASAQGWMPAVVPGTVLNTYVKNGVYPEPYYDLNNALVFEGPDQATPRSPYQKKLVYNQGKIPDACMPGTDFTFAHWFRAPFTLAPDYKGKTIWLNLDGVNWKGDVFLNGKLLGTMLGAYKRGKFDVTSLAAIGNNMLAVKVYPMLNPGIPHAAGCGGDRLIGLTPATILQTIGWDFTLVDGVRDRDMGVYRDVYITTTGPVVVRDPFIYTVGVPAEKANLNFRTFLVSASDAPQTGVLKLEFNGTTLTSKEIRLAAHESREVALGFQDYPQLTIDQPRLWWPAGRGAQELYDLKVSFVPQGGEVSDAVQTHFGIRSIEHYLYKPGDTGTGDQNAYKVNGHRIFLSGGNWVQDAMLRCTRDRYEAQVRMLAQAGFNWLRLWSGSGQEHDDLYEMCDKYGILLWVEAGLTAQTVIPDINSRPTPDANGEFKKVTFDNWGDTVRRIRNHPSVFYYCGCNEGSDVPGMDKVTAENDGTRDYQARSNAQGMRGSPYTYQGLYPLYDYSGVDVWGAGPLGIFGGFCNESGNPCLASVECLREMMPEGKLWPIDEETFKYHDGGGFHNTLKLVTDGAAQYGPLDKPDMAGRVGLENYGFKGQIVNAMQYRADAELWQRNKWEATQKFATGFALWTGNNTHPEVCARVFDYSLEPVASLYYLAHGCKPLHVQYDYKDNDISVVNNSFKDAGDLKVKAEIRNLDWSKKWSGAADVKSVTEEKTINGLIKVPPRDTAGLDDVHFVYVQLEDAAGKMIDDMLYWRSKVDTHVGADGSFTALNTMPAARLDVTAALATQASRPVATVTLQNPGSGLAFFNQLKIFSDTTRKLVRPCYYSDNYFSLLPGQTKTVTIEIDPKGLQGESPLLIIQGWNIGKAEIRLPGKATTPVVKPLPTTVQSAMAMPCQ